MKSYLILGVKDKDIIELLRCKEQIEKLEGVIQGDLITFINDEIAGIEVGDLLENFNLDEARTYVANLIANTFKVFIRTSELNLIYGDF